MAQANDTYALTDGGVAFTVVTLDFAKHDCIISTDALYSLSRKRGSDFGPLQVFEAFEARIRGTARRLIAAKVKSDPLRLEPHSFH